jgi:hypothetical protein
VSAKADALVGAKGSSSKQPPAPPPLQPAAVGGLLLLACVCAWLLGTTLHHRLLIRSVLTSPIAEPPDGLPPLDLQAHAADEMLLRHIVEECAKRQDTVLFLDAARQLVVADTIDPACVLRGRSLAAFPGVRAVSMAGTSSSCVSCLTPPAVADAITPHCHNRHCPIVDVMLRSAERGVGTCTDVALYVMHCGARVIPMPQGGCDGVVLPACLAPVWLVG